MILLSPGTPICYNGLPASCTLWQKPTSCRLTSQQQLLTCQLCSDARRKDKQGLTGIINIPYSLGLKVVTSVKDLYIYSEHKLTVQIK